METISETPKKMIIISIPGETFSSRFFNCWTNTLGHLWKENKYDFVIATGSSSFVTFARMQTLGLSVLRGADQKPFNGLKFDVWITIDSDIIFSPDQLMELIDATDKHPVVSGYYRMSDLTNLAVVKDWDLDYFAKNGSFKFLTHDDVDTWKKETELNYMPVCYTGLGFFACKSEVLYKMKYPYFDGDVEEIKLEDGTIIRDISSEDVNFCKNVKKAGYDIFVNCDLHVGHYKHLVI